MRKTRKTIIIIVGLSFLAFACQKGNSNGGDGSEDDMNGKLSGDSDSSGDTESGSLGELDSDFNDSSYAGDYFDVDSGPSSGGPEVCETLDVVLEGVPVRLMLLHDRSGSMEDRVEGTPKWNLAEDAVKNMVTTWGDTIDIGIDFFSDPSGVRNCTVTPVVASDCLANNTEKIIDLMNTEGPFTSDGGGRTPLYLAIENFLTLTHAPIFLDGHVESYLVVVSDGKDNCSAEGERGGGHSPDEFASLVSNLLAQTSVKTIVIGFGDEADPEQLNAIASNGGTQFTEFFNASDGVALQEALSTIGESIHVGCTFAIGEQDTEEVNLDLVNVYMDDTPIPRDDGCSAGTGWSWTDGNRTAIEFCGETCEKVQQGSFDRLSVEIMCSEDELFIV